MEREQAVGRTKAAVTQLEVAPAQQVRERGTEEVFDGPQRLWGGLAQRRQRRDPARVPGGSEARIPAPVNPLQPPIRGVLERATAVGVQTGQPQHVVQVLPGINPCPDPFEHQILVIEHAAIMAARDDIFGSLSERLA